VRESKEKVESWASRRESAQKGFEKNPKDFSISYFDSTSNLIRISNDFFSHK
jgi:hypothetical protein